jgi:hypothetical protein
MQIVAQVGHRMRWHINIGSDPDANLSARLETWRNLNE